MKPRDTRLFAQVSESYELFTFVVNYVDGILKGDVRTTAGENYTPNSLKIWKQFRRIFLDFYDKKPFSWDDINKELADRYTNYHGKRLWADEINDWPTYRCIQNDC